MWWKGNPLTLIAGMEIGTVTMENIMKVPRKAKIRVAIWSSNLTPGHISRENYNLKRHMHPKVHCPFIIAKTWKQPKNLKFYTYTHTPHTCTQIHTQQNTAAAAAKSLQPCPTLCDPIDGSPPGSPILGILQARTLEWVAISFSSAWKWKVKVKSLSPQRPHGL